MTEPCESDSYYDRYGTITNSYQNRINNKNK